MWVILKRISVPMEERMTTRKRRTVLGSVLDGSVSAVDTDVNELPGLLSPDETPSSSHGRILAWLEKDARRNPSREQRRVFEVHSTDGRVLMSVEVDM
jgi:hypothetical protein